MNPEHYKHVSLGLYAVCLAEPGKEKVKVKVFYYDSKDAQGRETIMVNDKSYGHQLQEVLPDGYRNESDSMTDYFCHGSVEIGPDHPLYEQAKAVFARLGASRKARKEAKELATRDAVAAKAKAADEAAAQLRRRTPPPQPPAPAPGVESGGILAW